MDKPELMLTVLDRYDVRFSQHRAGWQSVRCPNEFAHAHGDQNPSARLNLTLGLITCMGCELNGDAYTLVMAVEGVSFVESTKLIGKVFVQKEENWLI